MPQLATIEDAGAQIDWRVDRIPFTKMSGSGNDFIVLDHRAAWLAEDDLPSFVRGVCSRGAGLGADGAVLIEHASPDQPEAHFRWRYLNADGAEADLCGNGAMCGARFAVLAGIAPGDCRFETPAGLIEAHVPPAKDDPRVRIGLQMTAREASPVEIVTPDGAAVTFARVVVGVPHAVLVVDDIGETSTEHDGFHAFGAMIRHHEAFGPDGTNVNVVQRIDDTTLRTRTFERGVEAETLACGTGAIASAIVSYRAQLVRRPVSVLTSGGGTLTVDFDWRDDQAEAIRLGGEARVIAEGMLHPEMWR